MIDLSRVLGNHGGCPVDDKGKAKCTESNLHDGWPERVQKGYRETPQRPLLHALSCRAISLSLLSIRKRKNQEPRKKKNGQNGNKGRERGGGGILKLGLFFFLFLRRISLNLGEGLLFGATCTDLHG